MVSVQTSNDNNKSSFTYATVVTNGPTACPVATTAMVLTSNAIIPVATSNAYATVLTNGPSSCPVVAVVAPALATSASTSNASSAPVVTCNVTSPVSALEVPHSSLTQQHQQQQQIGDIPNPKNHKTNTPVAPESEWKEVKSRRRRPEKHYKAAAAAASRELFKTKIKM